MRITNKQILPRLTDSISFLYVEHCRIDQEDSAIAKHDSNGITHIPVATISALFVGPGVSITHAAIKNISDCGCSVIWVGEGCLRFYANGMPETHSSKNLLHQAEACMNQELHMAVIKRMYSYRFQGTPIFNDASLSLEQLRGYEGVRVKTVYAQYARMTGIPWYGREYSLSSDNWNSQSTINKSLSIASQILYGVCHAAIVTLGYSPGLGFIHTGRTESFTYDIADLYRLEVVVPAAFMAAKQFEIDITQDLDRIVRKQMRIYLKQQKVFAKIADDIAYVLGYQNTPENDVSTDPSTMLWGEDGDLPGGISYSDTKGR